MERAGDNFIVEDPLAQGAPPVRAEVVDTMELAAHVKQRQFPVADHNGLAFARLQVGHFSYFDEFAHGPNVARQRVAVKRTFQYVQRNMSPVANQSRLQMAVTRLDAANAADPNGHELDYANRLSAWVHRLDPAPAEALQLAARAQHLQRWLIPRESYPSDRVGYLKWRADLKQFHAQQAGAILVEIGYDEATITAVQDLIRKRNFPHDPASRVLEDALCLVFLETQFSETTAKTGPDKMIQILQKTWKKMTPQAQSIALTLPLPAAGRALVERALQASNETDGRSGREPRP